MAAEEGTGSVSRRAAAAATLETATPALKPNHILPQAFLHMAFKEPLLKFSQKKSEHVGFRGI